jgi:transcriptional regulator with XRE-family HTH domain
MVAPENETVLSAARKRAGMTLKDLADALGVSTSAAGRYCLPRSNAHHRRPSRTVGERLRGLFDGAVTVANYADPEFGEPASVPEDVQ